MLYNESTGWKQAKCLWNQADWINNHKCTVKNISICKYFCGVQYLDALICWYPHKNDSVDTKETE